MRSPLWASILLLSSLLPTLPAQGREVVRLQTRCYVQQSNQALDAYPCELRLIYNDPTRTSGSPDAVQVKWAYGGLSEFLYNPSQGWKWLEPTSKTWVPASPSWLRTASVSCYRFGNMCFGRGFPAPEPATTATVAATIPRPTPAPVSRPGSSTAATPAKGNEVGVDEAIACIDALYAALSAQDFAAARRSLDGQAASQFDGAFFRQFRSVRANRYRATNDPGSGLTLIANTRYEYRDGSVQVEQRSFRIERRREGLRVVRSQFIGIVEPRAMPQKTKL